MFFIFLEVMARLLNSRWDFDNGFYTCDLPEDAVLLVVMVKTMTGNNTLVEDTEKWMEKFRPWKKSIKDWKTTTYWIHDTPFFQELMFRRGNDWKWDWSYVLGSQYSKDHYDYTQGKFSLPKLTQPIWAIRTWHRWWNNRYHQFLGETS